MKNPILKRMLLYLSTLYTSTGKPSPARAKMPMSNQTNGTIVAINSNCPYSESKTSTLIADSSLCDGVCEVKGSTCTLVRSYGMATSIFSNISAIGRFTSYRAKRLTITDSNTLNIQRFELPSTVTSLSLERIKAINFVQLETPLSESLTKLRVTDCGVDSFPSDFAWPSKLLEVNFDGNRLSSIPRKLPINMDSLSIQRNQLANVSGLPRKLGSLHVDGNKIDRVIGRDWTTMNTISLGENPVKTIAFVKLSTTLIYFGCPNCPLDNITLDPVAYMALNALEPWQGDDNKLRGFRITDNVAIDSVACHSINGHIKPLWEGQSNVSVTACVVNSASSNIVAPYVAHFTDSQFVLAGVVFSFIVSIAVCIFLKCREKHKKKIAQNGLKYMSLQQSLSERSVSTYDSFQSESSFGPLRRLHGLQIADDDVIVTSKCALASGVFGEIWLGLYEGEKVAVKRLKDTSPRSIGQFVDEIVLHASLSNEHIVKCIGAQWQVPTDLQCILEYMDMGDLRAYLATRSPASFSWSEKCKALQSAVSALVYLHDLNPPMIHRDFKSKNILMDSQKGAKLTDFGEKAIPSPAVFQWMSPEILNGTVVSTASDIFSLGVVMSELTSHIVPYADMKRGPNGKIQNVQVLMKKVASGELKPTLQTYGTPAWFLDLAGRCLAQDPSARPTAAEALNKIRHFKPIESTSRMSKRG